MDKFAVVTEDEQHKIASLAGRPCPQCGTSQVDYKGLVPHCPNCGTEPWEKRHGTEEKTYR